MSVKTMLPVEDNCKRSIKRYRPHLPTPAHRGELTIPAELVLKTDRDIISGSFCCFKLYYSLSYQNESISHVMLQQYSV
jgi:hypothetical protein